MKIDFEYFRLEIKFSSPSMEQPFPLEHYKYAKDGMDEAIRDIVKDGLDSPLILKRYLDHYSREILEIRDELDSEDVGNIRQWLSRCLNDPSIQFYIVELDKWGLSEAERLEESREADSEFDRIHKLLESFNPDNP